MSQQLLERMRNIGEKDRDNAARQTTWHTRVSVWDVAARKEIGNVSETVTGVTSPFPVSTAGHGRFLLKTETVYEGEGK